MNKGRLHNKTISTFRDRSIIRDRDPRRSNVHVLTHKLVDVTRSYHAIFPPLRTSAEERRRQREKSLRDAISVEKRASKL